MVAEFERVLTARWGADGADTIDGYLKTGGYEGLRAALNLSPQDVIETVKASGRPGPRGAGFTTPRKNVIKNKRRDATQ